jgi:hypothetical protein
LLGLDRDDADLERRVIHVHHSPVAPSTGADAREDINSDVLSPNGRIIHQN